MYPIFLNLKDKRCLVVGGGEVAQRKVLPLVKSGGRVEVVAPAATAALSLMAASGEITLSLRHFKESDLNGVVLVIAATDNPEVNSAVFSGARRKGALVNVVDFPEECDFYVPSVVARGDLMLAISTGGKSPSLARKIREDLECEFGPEYERFLNLLGIVRRKLMKEGNTSDYNRKRLNTLVGSELLEAVRRDDEDDIDRILQRIMGPEYSLNNIKAQAE